MSAELDPAPFEITQSRAPDWAEVEPNFGRARSTSTEFGPSVTKCGANVTAMGQIWSGIVPMWPDFGQTQPNSADVGRSRPNLTWPRAALDRIRPKLARPRRICGQHPPMLAKLGLGSTKSFPATSDPRCGHRRAGRIIARHSRCVCWTLDAAMREGFLTLLFVRDQSFQVEESFARFSA